MHKTLRNFLDISVILTLEIHTSDIFQHKDKTEKYRKPARFFFMTKSEHDQIHLSFMMTANKGRQTQIKGNSIKKKVEIFKHRVNYHHFDEPKSCSVMKCFGWI